MSFVRGLGFTLLVVWLANAPQSAFAAAPVTFTSVNGGDWGMAGTWSAVPPGDHLFPVDGDTAIVNHGVTLSGNQATDVLTLQNSATLGLGVHTLLIDGAASGWLSGALSGGTLDQRGTLTLSTANAKTLLQSTLNNSGTLSLTSTGNLQLSNGSVLLNGSGMGSTALFNITSDADVALFGSGMGNAPLLNNSGTVRKAAGGGDSFINIDIINQNGGLIEATSGRLQLTGTTLTNTGGTVRANGGNVQFASGINVIGGTLESMGTSLFDLTFVSLTFTGPTNSGHLRTASNTPTTVGGGSLVNNGTWQLGNSIGATPSLTITGDFTFSGTGDLFMSDSNTTINNANGAVLTSSVGHTIRGRGNFNAPLVNSGDVRSEIGALNLNGLVTNHGTLTATITGDLVVNNSQITNHHIVTAEDGARVVVQSGSGRIIGGTLQRSGTGEIRLQNNGGITDVTNQGYVRVISNNVGFVDGTTLHNDGTIELGNDIPATPTLQFSAPIAVSGTGDIFLSDSNATLGAAGGVTVTQAATHEIHGRGLITASMNNQGTIRASTGQLILTSGTKTNSGTMAAESGQTLRFDQLIDNATGLVIARDASTVLLNGNLAAIQGGTLDTEGSGVILSSNGGIVDVTNQGLFRVASNTATAVSGTTLTNNATIEVGTGIPATPSLVFNTDVALAGTGNIFLRDSQATLSTAGAARVTIPPTQDVHGRGNVHASVDNDGIIRATTGQLVLHTNPKTNTGTIAAESGQTLRIDITTNNTGGLIVARDASQVQLNGGQAVVQGGTLDTEGSGVFLSSNGGITDVTNQGLFRVGSNTTTSVNGTTFTNNGTIDVGTNIAASPTLLFNTDIVLAGTGDVFLSDSNAHLSTSGSARLTVPATQDIHGRGTIAAALNNDGIIRAHTGTLVLNTLAKNNTGTIAAESAQTLRIDVPINNTGGLIVARVASQVNLNSTNAQVQGGELDTEGSGVILSSNAGIADVTNHGFFRVQPNTNTAVGGTTLVNHGIIEIGQNIGATPGLVFVSSVDVSGNGELFLSDSNTFLSSVAGAMPIFGPGLLIHGRANMVTSGLNLGSIVGDHPTSGLIISPTVTPGLFNGGHIHVSGPQNLTINTATNFTNFGDVQIDAGRILTVNNGPYRTTGGNTMVAGTLQASGGVALLGGILSGTGTVTGTVNNDGGTVAPGTSAGTLSVAGAYAQSAAGELLIEIGGANAGEFDKLAMTGMADLCGGTLVIDVINGFVPTPGQTFVILTASTVQGGFDSVVQDCTSGILFNVTVNANNVTLTAAAGACGNRIVSSNAPNGSVDARRATLPNGTGSFGPTSVAITFASAPGALTAADFAVSASNGAAPTISTVNVVGNVATVTFSGIIPQNSWTTVQHIASNTATTIGFRPGDVNADGSANTIDPTILALGLGGHLTPALSQRSCDINRSTVCNAEDITHLMDLLNGAGGFDPQNGVTHPTCNIP